MMSARSFTLTSLGRPVEALLLAQDCLEATEVAGSPAELVWAQMARCAALTATGDLALAVEAGELAVAAARTVSLSVITSAAAWWCADAYLEIGEPERAITLLLDLLGGEDLPRWYVAGGPLCYETLTRAELALGHPDKAEHWARRGASIAASIDLPISRAYAARSQAEVAFAHGDAPAAASLAERSAEYAQISGAPIEAARARLLAGRAHVAGGNRERAAEMLRSAEAAFAACGAKRWRAQTVRELRGIGRRVHRSAQRATPGGDGIDALSGREREVVELVCDHRTNREIAGSLFLSEKTVESHLRNIFVKAGVRSRGDLVRALRQVT
jgi:ATP/maltotriose-dependent transcriptional regulator MalT